MEAHQLRDWHNIIRTKAAFNPPAIASCVYFAAYTTAIDPPQKVSHPSANQAHHCLTSMIMETGVCMYVVCIRLPHPHDNREGPGISGWG